METNARFMRLEYVRYILGTCSEYYFTKTNRENRTITGIWYQYLYLYLVVIMAGNTNIKIMSQ